MTLDHWCECCQCYHPPAGFNPSKKLNEQLVIALSEKKESIGKLIKEHNMLRRQLDIARRGFEFIQGQTPQERDDYYNIVITVVEKSLNQMDEVFNEYFKNNIEVSS